MGDTPTDSVAFYNRNASRFALETADADMSVPRARFLRRMTPGAHILDAGCGVGRDALAFADLGYRVTALDASREMVRLARARLQGRAEIVQARFEDIVWRQEFNGVWACASLLHVPLAQFAEVMIRLADSMSTGAVCYMSFKYGVGERRDGDRRFTDHTEVTLQPMLASIGLNIVDLWISGDVRPGRENERWLNTIADHDRSGIG